MTDLKNLIKEGINTANVTVFKESKKSYLKAQAYNDMVSKMDKKAKQRILDEFTFYDEETDERITRPLSDYNMNKENFREYCILVKQELKEKGLNIPDWNTTSDYESRPLLNTARDNFIDSALNILPAKVKEELKDIKHHYDICKKFIELTLQLSI